LSNNNKYLSKLTVYTSNSVMSEFRNTLSIIFNQITNYLDRDDNLISQEAIDILSNPDDKEALLVKVKELRDDDKINEGEVILSGDRTIQIMM